MTLADLHAERIPPSFGQEQLWFLDQLDPGQATYNIPLTYRLHGPLDVATLTGALDRLVTRHEALRTRFEVADGAPCQVIAPPSPLGTRVEDVAEAVRAGGPEVVEQLLDAEARAPFDLAAGPLFRARILRTGDDEHVLCLTAHHAIADGWSVGLLAGELSQLYAAGIAGRDADLPALAVQYGDYALWQRDWLQGESLTERLDYWEHSLAGAPVLDLPTDRPRPAVPSGRGDVLVHEFDPTLLAGARLLARDHGASLFMVLATAFAAVLARHSGQDDFTIGTTMLGRMRPELERVIGLFVNMVALRCDASGDPSFAGLLDRMREVTLGAYDHQEVPFEQVVGRVERGRDPSRNPLFQVGMQVLSDQTGGGTLDLVGIDTEAALRSPGGARFDLSMTYTETAERLSVSVEYTTDLFDRWRVEQIVTHIERALAAAVADPGTHLSRLPLVNTTEHDRLLTCGRGEDLAYRREPVHTIVAEQARLRPDAVAAVYEDQQLTYRELHRRARLLASHLRGLGVEHQDVVAVASERGLDTLVALIGVLQAGAAFTVLEPSHPHKRLRFILADTAAKVVVTNAAVLASLPEPDGWVPVCLDRDWPAIAAPTGGPDWTEWCTGDSLAYVLYTSGTTGNPKGVLIEHRALMLYVASFTRLFDLTPADRLLQYASLVFDLAEAEIFSALTVGATLVLGSRDTLMSPEALADLIRRERVTYLGAPPAMLALLDAEPYPDLHGVLAGGEAFSGDLVNRWNLPGRRFVNGYGPTETTVGCTAYVCAHAQWRSSPPIGPPLPHRRLYVVDRDGGLAPVGVPGELLIGGDEGLARGYLNQPELTAERFVPDPFRPQGRVYHSGDLVRWRPDGLLEFVGRIDNQVKLRGLRIELDEIQAVICRHRAVDQCVVVVREDRPGDSQLVAYLVPGDTPPSVADLRAHVGLELPAYMIPSAWVTLDALPLAVSGKVDRTNLPAPAGSAERSRTPLSTPTEEAVGAICAEILGMPAVGADDNFFELGGTSLQAIQLVSRLTDQLGTTVTVRTVYGGSTISALAAQLDESMGTPGSSAPPPVRPRRTAPADSNGHGRGDSAVSPSPAWSPLVPLSAGNAAPLYCVHSVSGSVFPFAGLARLLDDRHPFVAIEASGVSGGPPLEVGLDELAATYLHAIDTEHPGEPAMLMGWSMGGVVAFAMANQLEAAGRRAPRLVLVDAPVPTGAGAPDDHECLTQFARDLAEATGRTAPTLPPPPPQAHVEPDGVDTTYFGMVAGALRAAALVPAELDDEILRTRYRVFRANTRALYDYLPDRRYRGPVTLVRAAESEYTRDGWERFVNTPAGATIDEHVVPGTHHTIWNAENLPALAEIITRLLATTDTHAPRSVH